MKSRTLKENKDFRRVYYKGQSEASGALVTYAAKSRLPYTRVGITSGKKIGGAVQRNRARRVIRAAYSIYEPQLEGCWDIVFVARTRTTEVKMQEVAKQMEAQLKKLGLLSEKPD